MKTCPRCESSIDDEARYCIDCGAPQTEAAAEELDEYVQRQAQQVASESGASGNGFGDEAADDGGDDGFVATANLTDRQQLWRRGCYVAGYGTIVVALTLVPRIGAFFLILGGIAILPPIRRLTAEPLGSSLKREVMVGLYAILSLVGVLLLVFL